MRTRAEWCNLLEGTDACFAPVLDFEEARAHPHNRARGAVRNVFGLNQPQPAPLFSRTPGGIRSAPAIAGGDNIEVLSDWSPNQEPGR
jgi:alpha-methylacyl-CoA racemase